MWWLSWFNGKSFSFNDFAIAFVKGNDYRICFLYMSKDEDITLLRNADSADKTKALQNLISLYHVWKLNKEIVASGDNKIEKRKIGRH